MTSQLNVDTIVDKAGSGGTNVKIGNTSTYVSDAGAVTQNLVQGVAKCFCRYDSTQFTESFNFSTFTDNSTGDHTFAYTNNMNNSVYVITMQHEGGYSGDTYRYGCEAVSNTSIVNMEHFTLNSSSGPTQNDLGDNGLTIHGDLA